MNPLDGQQLNCWQQIKLNVRAKKNNHVQHKRIIELLVEQKKCKTSNKSWISHSNATKERGAESQTEEKKERESCKNWKDKSIKINVNGVI